MGDYLILVVPVTFGHSWLRHSSHPERAVVLTDVVRVSEPAVCILMLSVRVFIPFLDVRKFKTPVLTFEPWFPKVLKIFENTFLYITVDSFGSGGAGGRGKFLYLPLVRWERDAIRSSFLPFERLQCFVKTVCTQKPWWSNLVTD
jgi:hypothetical protein